MCGWIGASLLVHWIVRRVPDARLLRVTAIATDQRGETPTFGAFVGASEAVPFDPAKTRIFVRFTDGGGVIRGATSVAVRAQ